MIAKTKQPGFGHESANQDDDRAGFASGAWGLQVKCLRCGAEIQPLQLHQICRRYSVGLMFTQVYRCAAHFLVYDLTWSPGRGWHRGRVDRATYRGGTENYGQGYSWKKLPNERIAGAATCKSCGRLLDLRNQQVQMSILVKGDEILDVLFQCVQHW